MASGLRKTPALSIQRTEHSPYHVVLIDGDDYARLMEHVKFNRLPAVFAYSQLFGSLPGFDFHEGGLMVPENYAVRVAA